jgi:hypothetical protein
MKCLPTASASSSTPADKQLEGYVIPMAGEYLPAWKDILRKCGYPQTVVVLDFETYFDDEFKMAGKGDGLSTIEYVRDSKFEVLLLSALKITESFPNYEGTTWSRVGEDEVASYLKSLQEEFGENLEGCTVVMQNARFDATVLAVRYNIFPPNLIDTLGLARHWNARANNDLDSQAKRWSLPAKGDTSEFKGYTFRSRFFIPKSRKKGPKLPKQMPVMTDEQVNKLCNYANNDVMREWELFTILLPKLSRPDIELMVMKQTLDLFIRPTLTVDYAKGDDLCQKMEAEIDRHVTVTGMTRKELTGDLRFEEEMVKALTDAGDDPNAYFKAAKNKAGRMLALAKDDNERKFLEGHESERIRLLMAGRIAADGWPNHIKRIQRIMRMAKCNSGLLPVPLKYHGAHTGRDSGGEKINLQNLGNRGHELVNAVRELIVSLPGYSLIIVDAKAVECRGVNWIAGQQDVIQGFEYEDANPGSPEDTYTKFASKVLGHYCRKPKKKGGIPAIEKSMKWARGVGKIGELGCGYGMGTLRIFDYGAGSVDFETAEKIKVTYRETHDCVVRFWKDVERAFIYTAKYGQPCEMPRGIKFHQLPACDVVLTLPSGRELHYHKVKLVDDDRGDKIEVYNEMEHCWGHIWGGAITENIVQAFCRDFLMEAAIRLDKLGLHTALRVHDELVIPVPDADAKDALKIAEREMSRRPLWALDCPLGAEGKISKRYGDH